MSSPIRFGLPGRQLFGLFQTPPAGVERSHSVLICNPFGQEYIRCHRLLRLLADRLVREGFHVLRFDYFGTGDSDGDDSEGDLSRWQDDVLLANAELSERSGNPFASWLGLRLGASIAAITSKRLAIPPYRLVLWDPVVEGADYLHELETAHAAGLFPLPHWDRKKLASVAAASMKREILGFPISAAIRQQIASLGVDTLTTARAQSLEIFGSHSNRDVNLLEQNPATFIITTHFTNVETQSIWASDAAMNAATVPIETINAIVKSFLATS